MNQFKIRTIISCIFLVFVIVICTIVEKNINTSTVIISEIRTDFDSVLYDATGDYHGFVELYNNSSKRISLDGWYISDSEDSLKKYQITDCTLDPNEFIVFWTNSLSDVNYVKKNFDYFLDFSIDSTETIFLSNPQGIVVDKVKTSNAERELSYSLLADGWGMRQATPGYINQKEKLIIKPKTPVLSHKSGFYDSEIELSISCGDSCNIYYTLDGTIPTEKSNIYTESIILKDISEQDNVLSAYTNITIETVTETTPKQPVPKANIIRAIAVDEDGNRSDEVQGTYFINYDSRYGFENLHIVSIITDPNNLFDDKIGIYVTGDVWDEVGSKIEHNNNFTLLWTAPRNFRMEGKGWRRLAYMEMFDKERNLINAQNIAISIHGGYSTCLPQKGFNLYSMPDTAGNRTIDNEIFVGEQRSALLRTNGIKDYYSTKFRDVLNQSLVEDRNIGIQHAVACQVFIDGEYWGLYSFQERLDETYVAAHYNVDSDNVILIKNSTVVSGVQEEYQLYQQVIDYAVENDLSQKKHYDQICKWIDIQSYIDYYSFQIYVANSDIITNNYALWRTRDVTGEKYGDGKWRWLLYDTDDSTGVVPVKTDFDINSFENETWRRTPSKDALFHALSQNDEFVRRFVKSFIEIGKNNFDYEKIEDIIDKMLPVYMPAAVTSHQRFISADYSEDVYEQEVKIVKDFFKNRYQYIYQYMLDYFNLQDHDNE